VPASKLTRPPHKRRAPRRPAAPPFRAAVGELAGRGGVQVGGGAPDVSVPCMVVRLSGGVRVPEGAMVSLCFDWRAAGDEAPDERTPLTLSEAPGAPGARFGAAFPPRKTEPSGLGAAGAGAGARGGRYSLLSDVGPTGGAGASEALAADGQLSARSTQQRAGAGAGAGASAGTGAGAGAGAGVAAGLARAAGAAEKAGKGEGGGGEAGMGKGGKGGAGQRGARGRGASVPIGIRLFRMAVEKVGEVGPSRGAPAGAGALVGCVGLMGFGGSRRPGG
jgi:hypothetical protein